MSIVRGEIKDLLDAKDQRIKELEAEVERLKDVAPGMLDIHLLSRIEKLRAALENYTDSRCFKDPESMVEDSREEHKGIFSEPNYDCYPCFNANPAREALAEDDKAAE